MSTQIEPGLPDTEAAPPAGGNLTPYTVGELARAVKRTIEGSYGLVRVRGELLRVKRHTSGHIYLCLKDDDAVLDGVIWRSGASRLGMIPEDGIEVICTGRITTYPARSSYQLVIESMELAGQGALLKLIEERRKKLAAEGLFAAERKRLLPSLPGVIGVVTSPTGAVIRDILHRLADRFPRDVLIWPVAVQGANAAAEIAAAITGFNALPLNGWPRRPDVLIVARGGGAIEDLMAFNEEIVVRAAAASGIPLISAVGHETDTTLIDFASDMRAPTPTAAAEFAVPVRLQLLARVEECSSRLMFQIERSVAFKRSDLQALERGLGNPRHAIEAHIQRLDSLDERLDGAKRNYFDRLTQSVATWSARLRHPLQQIQDLKRHLDSQGRSLDAGFRRSVDSAQARFQRWSDLLESYSYRGVLKRGFVLVTDRSGHAVGSSQSVQAGDAVALEFHDGKVEATVDGTAGGSAKPRRAAPANAPKSGPQGRLF
ncbi:MAG: xseA [Rhodospirillales bacterium]|nr:xseA [Rhodospirillales bacterium]